MNISEAAQILDVSRQTMMTWLSAGDVFPGAYKENDTATAAWHIPAKDVEAMRQKRLAELGLQIARLSKPAVEHD